MIDRLYTASLFVSVATIFFALPLHAQNPTDVVGPYLIEPLSQARSNIGAASASQYNAASFGRTDYFAFAGGDTGAALCKDALTDKVDVYLANMGLNPTTYCKGLIGCVPPKLSAPRSFVSGVGVTFPPPPTTAPRRTGYLIFAGGLVCDPNDAAGKKRLASNIVDIVGLTKPSLTMTTLTLSSARNYIASSSLCKLIKGTQNYNCVAFFAGGQMGGNTYSSTIDVLDLNPDVPVWLDQKQMTTARAFLASASFVDSMLFAGGKFESGLVPPIITTVVGQVDYFDNGVIVPSQNLSKPRWELSAAGLIVRVADQIDYTYAVFVGGIDQSNTICKDIDVWTVPGGDTPYATTAALNTARTAPTVAVLARYSQQPIIVVTGGDSNSQAGCQPAATAEFMPIDVNADKQTVSPLTSPMMVGGASVAACDTATASNEFYILQAGGTMASGATTNNVVAFCWGSCPQLPAPPANNDAAPASADLSPGSKAALAIFFITYFANIAGVWFYCREKAVNMPLPLVSAVVGWILCWVYILFVLPAMNKQKMQDRADLQNRML